MMVNLAHILILIAALQLKHFICDGPLQTTAMVRDKGHYGRWLGVAHAGLHGLGTMLVLAFFGFALNIVLVLAVLDFVLHYHIDFAKEKALRSTGLTIADPRFWWALSADQALHQFTYLLLAYLALSA